MPRYQYQLEFLTENKSIYFRYMLQEKKKKKELEGAMLTTKIARKSLEEKTPKPH